MIIFIGSENGEGKLLEIRVTAKNATTRGRESSQRVQWSEKTKKVISKIATEKKTMKVIAKNATARFRNGEKVIERFCNGKNY